jgi:hypothetical protein
VAERERGLAFEFLRGSSVVVAVTLVLAALTQWLSGDWTEAANQRVLTCTVTDTLEGAGEWGIRSTATTAECGQLVIPTDTILTPPQFRNGPLNGHVEVGHTYRLRVGDVNPPLGPAFLRIVAIDGER